MPVRVRMETLLKETGFSLLDQQQVKKRPQVFGYNLLVTLNLLCGQYLRVPPIDKLNLPWRLMVGVLEAILLLTTTLTFAATGHSLYKRIGNIEFAVYLAAGFIGIGECLFRMIYTDIKRRKIEEVYRKMQVVLNYSFVGKDNKEFIRKVSRNITIKTIIFCVLVIFALGSSFYTITEKIEKLHDDLKSGDRKWDNLNELDGSATMEEVEAWEFFQLFFEPTSSIVTIKLFALVSYVFNFLVIARMLVSDILFYSWYFIIINQYEDLAQSLKTALASEKDGFKLAEWIEVHNFTNELLTELNALCSPVVVLAVVVTGLQICTMSFAVLKMHEEVNLFMFLGLGMVSVYQVLVYCLIGQKIRDQAKILHLEAYKGPWLMSSNAAQHAVLMICSVSNEKVGHSLPGAPFFALSLEFFASIFSAVITYFVILIQMK